MYTSSLIITMLHLADFFFCLFVVVPPANHELEDERVKNNSREGSAIFGPAHVCFCNKYTVSRYPTENMHLCKVCVSTEEGQRKLVKQTSPSANSLLVHSLLLQKEKDHNCSSGPAANIMHTGRCPASLK